ncbi:unnamed protein product [Ixodes persulcatus]
MERGFVGAACPTFVKLQQHLSGGDGQAEIRRVFWLPCSQYRAARGLWLRDPNRHAPKAVGLLVKMGYQENRARMYCAYNIGLAFIFEAERLYKGCLIRALHVCKLFRPQSPK